MPIRSSGMNFDNGSEEERPRAVSGGFNRSEDTEEFSLRPKRLTEYIGQPKIKENLGIALAAAKMRGEPLDHTLLHGPPGLGKTRTSSPGP